MEIDCPHTIIFICNDERLQMKSHKNNVVYHDFTLAENELNNDEYLFHKIFCNECGINLMRIYWIIRFK